MYYTTMTNKPSILMINMTSWDAKDDPLAKAWNHFYNIIDKDLATGTEQIIKMVDEKIEETYHGKWIFCDCFEFASEESLTAFLLTWAV